MMLNRMCLLTAVLLCAASTMAQERRGPPPFRKAPERVMPDQTDRPIQRRDGLREEIRSRMQQRLEQQPERRGEVREEIRRRLQQRVDQRPEPRENLKEKGKRRLQQKEGNRSHGGQIPEGRGERRFTSEQRQRFRRALLFSQLHQMRQEQMQRGRQDLRFERQPGGRPPIAERLRNRPMPEGPPKVVRKLDPRKRSI